MTVDSSTEQRLVQKIRHLPAHRVVEVEDFIDFLYARDHRTSDQAIVQAASNIAESAFAQVWDNPEDAVYENL